LQFTWAGVRNSIREFWDKLSRPQRIIIVAAPLAVAIALISLIYWASHPSYVAIFTKLDTKAAGEITTELKDLKVDYKLEDNGATILVPEKDAPEIRLELANAGLPQGSQFSWSESLNQTRVGETEADRKLRYVLGLQSELETTLKSMAGVQDARVHIVKPDQSLFIKEEKPTTAAITLKLAPNQTLTEEQVSAVANLMSKSVEGLTVDNVTIVDTNGSILSNLIGKANDPEKMTVTQMQLKLDAEERIRKSVQTMLDQVLGTGKTVVRANATLGFDQITTNTETHGPGAKVSEANTSEKTTNGTGAGTAPGVITNVPGYENPVAEGTTSSSEKSSSTINYQVDTTQEQRIHNQGDIERLSVSVMLDADSVSEDQANQIKTIVASAAGIVPARGDEVQVAAIPFDKTGLLQQEKEFAEAARRAQMRTYAELGAGALLALLFALFVLFRMRSKRKQKLAIALGPELQPVPLASAEELLLSQQEAEREADYKLAQKRQKSADEIQRQKVKESLDQYVQKNPDEVARLIKTWLTEER